MHVKETCKHSKETDTCLKEIYTRSQETIYIERKSLRECVCVCVCVCVCACVAAECLSPKDTIMNKTFTFYQETQGLGFS